MEPLQTEKVMNIKHIVSVALATGLLATALTSNADKPSPIESFTASMYNSCYKNVVRRGGEEAMAKDWCLCISVGVATDIALKYPTCMKMSDADFGKKCGPLTTQLLRPVAETCNMTMFGHK